MMTPYEQAKAVYLSEPCARTFEQDLQYHLHTGYVVNTPDYFIMGRMVQTRHGNDIIRNPAIWTRSDLCNCFHIYLAAGVMAKFWEHASPEILAMEFVSWERKNVLRIYPMSKVERLIKSID